MKIKYSLYENPFHPDKLLPKINNISKIKFAELVEKICYGSTLTRPDVIAVLDSLERVIQEEMSLGSSIELGNIGWMYPTITGTFQNINEKLNPKKHKLNFAFKVKKKFLYKIQRSAKFLRVESNFMGPVIYSYTDMLQKDKKGFIVPGSVGKIIGSKLKLNKSDEKLYLINLTKETRTEIGLILHNKPSGIMFQNPTNLDLECVYTYEVENRYKNSSQLRTGRLRAELYPV